MGSDSAPNLKVGLGKDTESQCETHQASEAFSFVLGSVRQFFSPGSSLPSASGIHWGKLLELAELHAVTGLLWETSRERTDLPGVAREQMRKCAADIARVDLTLCAELSRLNKLFNSNEIPFVSLKGPALRAILYGDAAFRSSSDLDLLIQPKDLLQIKFLLESTGYQMESVLHWPVDNACFKSRDSQLSFIPKIRNQVYPVCVDVHWRLLPGYFPLSFDERETFGKLQQVAIAGTFVPTLSREHLLLFLCGHATKHMWERLGWICDVARLIHVDPHMDWKLVFEEAQNTHTSRMVVMGLLLAKELFGVSLPDSVLEYTNKDQIAPTLVKTLISRLYDVSSKPASLRESASFSRRAFERTSHRMRFLMGLVIEPTEAEYQSLKLPPGLHWLYYLYRPLRLAAKYSRPRN